MTDIVERLRDTVQILATTQMNLSMEDWDKVSNAILDAAGAIKRLRDDNAELTRRETEAADEIERLRKAYSLTQDAVQQTLGRALGYPWFKDDQHNFPGATEADGVCVGDHVAESIADETAAKIAALRAALRAVDDEHGYGLPPETRKMIHTALKEDGDE